MADARALAEAFCDEAEALMVRGSEDFAVDPMGALRQCERVRALWEALPREARRVPSSGAMREALESSEDLAAIEVLRMVGRMLREVDRSSEEATVLGFREGVRILESVRFRPGQWEDKRLSALESARAAGLSAQDRLDAERAVMRVVDPAVRARASRAGSR